MAPFGEQPSGGGPGGPETYDDMRVHVRTVARGVPVPGKAPSGRTGPFGWKTPGGLRRSGGLCAVERPPGGGRGTADGSGFEKRRTPDPA
ncbi:hypothetical protein GCM10017750_56250 [Streptomyces racemochromogenes]